MAQAEDHLGELLKLPVEARARSAEPALARFGHADYTRVMTDRARKLLEDALTLSDDERLDLAEQLLSSLPSDVESLAELERRARRALADPQSGEAWDEVKRRLALRVASGGRRRDVACDRTSRESA